MRGTMICVMLTMLLGACGGEPNVYYRDDGETIGGDPGLLDEYHNNLVDFQMAGMDLEGERNVVKVQRADLSDYVPPGGGVVLGLCQFERSGFVITISPTLEHVPTMQSIVLIHEMAHCVLRENHYEGETDIMNAYLRDPDLIWSNFSGFKEKLFERVRGHQEDNTKVHRPLDISPRFK